MHCARDGVRQRGERDAVLRVGHDVGQVVAQERLATRDDERGKTGGRQLVEGAWASLAVSTSGLAVNGIVTRHSFAGSSFSSAVVLSTEFGIIIRLPLRSRTTVCRQLMSCTTPVVSLMLTVSPGWITC